MTSAIKVRGLAKSYGSHIAVDGVDLDVDSGEVVAILGPNGAGKTTTVEILEGFRSRDAGEVEVLGLDPQTDGRAIRDRIGIVLQQSGIEEELTVTEALDHQRLPFPSPMETRALIEMVGLSNVSGSRIKTLSGGQRRRLDLALALIGNPALLFLDEPTTGFDPEARRRTWQVIDELSTAGTTVLLTTHYLEEAQELADRVVVIVTGKVVASGSPHTLGDRSTRPATIVFEVSPEGASRLGLTVSNGVARIATTDPTRDLHLLTGRALESGVELAKLELRRPTLEDVYLSLIGDTDGG